MLRVRPTGVRLGVDRLDAHQPHQPLDPLAVDLAALTPEMPDHRAAAKTGVFRYCSSISRISSRSSDQWVAAHNKTTSGSIQQLHWREMLGSRSSASITCLRCFCS